MNKEVKELISKIEKREKIVDISCGIIAIMSMFIAMICWFTKNYNVTVFCSIAGFVVIPLLAFVYTIIINDFIWDLKQIERTRSRS